MALFTATSCMNSFHSTPPQLTPASTTNSPIYPKDTSSRAETTTAPMTTIPETTLPETQDPMLIEIESAKLAYQYLMAVHQACIYVMDSIYEAWHFAIYTADSYTSFNACFDEFCKKADLDKSNASAALEKAMDAYGYNKKTDSAKLEAMCSFDVTVTLVEYVYTSDGTYDYLDAFIDNAKTHLKSVTEKYKNVTGYEDLRKYYAKAKAYVEICEGVTGTFNQLKTTITDYESALSEYKYNLDIILN